MRRRYFALLLLASALGAAPKAAITAPASVPTGTLVRMDTTGTVSDVPAQVLVYEPAGASEAVFRADHSLAGFVLHQPGRYTFLIVASGKANPAAAVQYDIASCVTTVTSTVPTPPVPTPPSPPVVPSPLPSPQSASFTEAYRAYAGGMNAALLSISDDVTSGKITTKQDFLNALRAHSAPFTKAIDDLFAPNIDAYGRITQPATIGGEVKAAVKGVAP